MSQYFRFRTNIGVTPIASGRFGLIMARRPESAPVTPDFTPFLLRRMEISLGTAVASSLTLVAPAAALDTNLASSSAPTACCTGPDDPDCESIHASLGALNVADVGLGSYDTTPLGFELAWGAYVPVTAGAAVKYYRGDYIAGAVGNKIVWDFEDAPIVIGSPQYADYGQALNLVACPWAVGLYNFGGGASALLSVNVDFDVPIRYAQGPENGTWSAFP